MAQSFELPHIDSLIAPYKALNELAQSNVEKLLAVQTKNFGKYSEIALNNVRSASKLTDMEQSKAYLTQQTELNKKVAKDMAADIKAIVEMSQLYAAEARKVVLENVGNRHSQNLQNVSTSSD